MPRLLVAVPFVVMGFLLSWLIKEIPLRTTAFVATTRPDDGQPTGDGAAGALVGNASDPSPAPGAG